MMNSRSLCETRRNWKTCQRLNSLQENQRLNSLQENHKLNSLQENLEERDCRRFRSLWAISLDQ